MSWTVTSQPDSFPLHDDEWTSGLCSCCKHPKQCCIVCCCCPCLACSTSRKLGQCLCLPLLDIFGCIPAATMGIRINVRKIYGIKGSLCNDCVCATCCGPCVWSQVSTEMKNRKIPTLPGDLIGQ